MLATLIKTAKPPYLLPYIFSIVFITLYFQFYLFSCLIALFPSITYMLCEDKDSGLFALLMYPLWLAWNTCSTRGFMLEWLWLQGGTSQGWLMREVGSWASPSGRWWGSSNGIEKKVDSRVWVQEKNHQQRKGNSSVTWLSLHHVCTL